jgi:hypothetical protein
MKSLTVKVDDRLYRRLDRFIRKHGQTKNGLLRALLEAFLERPAGLTGGSLHPRHPFWDLVGSFRDRARDVSENVDAYLHGGKR